LVLLHHGESVAGLHLKGIVLEANDGAVDLRTVLELDLVRARGRSEMQQNERSEAGDCSGGYDPSTHAFEYRAGTRERQARAWGRCLVSQQEVVTAAGFVRKGAGRSGRFKPAPSLR